MTHKVVDHIPHITGPSAPTDLTAVQEGPTSIRVSWTPSSDATGYRIDYTSSDGSSDSVTVSGGSTDNYLLTGLQNGKTYTISIVATSQHFPGDSVTADTMTGLGTYALYSELSGCLHKHCSNTQLLKSTISSVLHQHSQG